MWKQFVADYFSFTKKERTGIITLLVLILICIIVPFLFPFFIAPKTNSSKLLQASLDSLNIQQAVNTSNRYQTRETEEGNFQQQREPSEKKWDAPKLKAELFAFDPNTIDAEGWRRLGLREKTITTIHNFVAKGGKFYKPTDIGKIWGLHEDEVERLLPHVHIKSMASTASYPEKREYEKKPYPAFEKKVYGKPSYKLSPIDINTADTTAFIALPGIGSKLAQRIISFREKLGGFYAVSQVGETFGLPDSTFQKIKNRFVVSDKMVHLININTATMEALKAHPYVRYALANAIFQYRSQHGNYASITDIKKIVLVTEELFVKLAPYLTVD